MILFADEGLDYPLVSLLRERGFQVIYAADELSGASDEAILNKAVVEDCVLITKDKDFGEMIIRQNKETKGIVLVRVEKLNDPENCMLVANMINQYSKELRGSFTVIQIDKIRIRNL